MTRNKLTYRPVSKMKDILVKSENVTKDKILMTAARLFANNGFEATSMREIAELCEVSKPALYYYFPDKKALFVEILKVVSDYSFQFLTEIEKSDKDPIDKLSEIATGQFLGIRKHPEVAKFLINVAMRNMPSGININFFEDIKKNESLLKKIINDGKDQGYFRSDMDVQSFLFCFTGGINNYIMRFFKQGIDELTTENAKKIINTLVEGAHNRYNQELQ